MKPWPLPLYVYLAASAVADPFVHRIYQRRLAAGKELAGRAAERKGMASIPRPPGRLVWFHAASVGETLSIVDVVRRLLDEQTDLSVLLTSNTVSSARILADALPARCIHLFSPYDARLAIRRFLDHWRPDLAIWVESELWPRMLVETSRRGIPMLLINGRVSEKTSRRWLRWPRTARVLLSPFRHILTQDDETARTMIRIGVPGDRVTVSGSTKGSLAPLQADANELISIGNALSGRSCWLAASTHEGEEEVTVRAHELAFRQDRGQAPEETDVTPLLVIAPRHPERGGGLANRLRQQGWSVALRSAKEVPDRATDIYIADTIGEMGIWYRLCPVAFLGGSLPEIGGHNPYEPIKLDCAVIHGPNVFNFKDIFATLIEAGGSFCATNAEEIADRLLELQDIRSRERLNAAARKVLDEGQPPVERVLTAIRDQLVQSKGQPVAAQPDRH